MTHRAKTLWLMLAILAVAVACCHAQTINSVGMNFSSIVAPPPQVNGGRVTLSWLPSPDVVAGYRVYYGTNSGSYNNAQTVGNLTNAVVSGLAEWQTYYFVVVAYASNGLESVFSNETNAYVYPKVDIVPTAFTARVKSRPNTTNVWSVSTDLVTWTKVQTNVGNGSFITLMRTNNGTQEYFRVK
jgi:hypothetical protein